MNKMRKGVINLLSSFASKIILIAIGIIVPRLTLLGYGSEVNGLLNSVNQFIIYLSLFEAGVQEVAIQGLYSPISTNDKGKINSILSAVNISYKKTSIKYCLVMLGMAVIYSLLIPLESIERVEVFIIVLFSGLPNVALFFLYGKYRILMLADGKNYVMTNLSTIIAVLNSVFKVILLLCGVPVFIIIIVNFFISLIQAIYIIIYVQKNYSWIDLKAEPDNNALKQKNSMLIHQIAGLVFQNTDVILLTLFCDLKVVSVYSIYKLIISQISSLITSLYESVTFALGQLFNSNKKKFIMIFDRVNICFSIAAFTIYTSVFMLLPSFIKLYTSGVTDINYLDERYVYLFVLIEILTLIRYPLLNVINYAKHFKETVGRAIIETLINLSLSIVGVYYWGIVGVLIGTACALLYRTIDVIIYTNKNIFARPPVKSLKLYISNCMVLITFVVLSMYVDFHIENYGEFFIHGIIITPICALIYLLIQSIINRREFAALVKIIKFKNIFRKGKNYE